MDVTLVPSLISTADEFEVGVGLTGLGKNTTYYLKGCFYQITTNYFGFTWNGIEWIGNSDSYLKQPSVTTDSEGAATINLKIKVDTNDSGFAGPGNYNFKVARYTPSGSLSWSSDFPITITAAQSPPVPISNLTLSEFMPNPDSRDEWAEVYNPQNYEIDIGGWKIDDIEGASSPFSIPTGTKIGPNAYLVFYFSSRLNNDGDTIRLLNSLGAANEIYTYQTATKGVSFAKDAQGAWQQTSNPTPGTANKITGVTTTTSTAKKTSSKKASSISKASTSNANSNSDVISSTPPQNETSEEGQVAGASSTNTKPNALSIILIAAGLAFLGSGFAWPFLKKRSE